MANRLWELTNLSTDFIQIEDQILLTYLQGNLEIQGGRITNQIKGVSGLTRH